MDTTILNSSPPAQPIITSSVPKPHLTIRASSGWQALNIGQVWRFRDLLITLAMRDIKLRYRQTALGAIWVILQPLLSAGILSFVFNTLAKLPTNGIPPIVFAYAGTLAFMTVFSSTLTKVSSSLVQNSQLISKVYFPRLVLPLSTVFSTLVDFSVGLGMMAFLMITYRIAPHAGLLLLPLVLILILMLAVGLGLLAAALMVSYRDVQYVLPVVVNLLTFASPVAFAASTVVNQIPENLRPFYFLLNPMAALLEAFRWSLLGGDMQWRYVLYSAFFSIFAFIGGAFAFRKMEKQFADVI